MICVFVMVLAFAILNFAPQIVSFSVNAFNSTLGPTPLEKEQSLKEANDRNRVENNEVAEFSRTPQEQIDPVLLSLIEKLKPIATVCLLIAMFSLGLRFMWRILIGPFGRNNGENTDSSISFSNRSRQAEAPPSVADALENLIQHSTANDTRPIETNQPTTINLAKNPKEPEQIVANRTIRKELKNSNSMEDRSSGEVRRVIRS